MRQFQIFERYDIRNIHIDIIKYLCKILKKNIGINKQFFKYENKYIIM